MIYKNIGIKAKHKNPEEVIKFLNQKNKAKYIGFDSFQRDTYLESENEDDDVRKIKKGNLENYFVGYKRRENSGLIEKDANIIELRKDPPEQLEKITRKTHDNLWETEKTRHIYWLDGIKFNIDKVRNLNDNYISIESIREQENFDQEFQQDQIEHYKDLLGIRDKDLVFDSYIEMLLNKKE